MWRRFLYYLPGPEGMSEQRLMALGIHDRFLGEGGRLCSWGARADAPGPDGGRGTILALGERPPILEPSERAPQWLDCGAYWVGIEDPKMPPEAKDLMRPTMMSGHEVELLGGSRWVVPLVLRWNREDLAPEFALPSGLCYEPQSKRFERKPLPPYRSLFELAERVWQGYVAEKNFPFEEGFAAAADLLNLNYRIAQPELALSGLLDEAVIGRVLLSAVDAQTVERCRWELAQSGLIRVTVPEDRDELERSSDV